MMEEVGVLRRLESEILMLPTITAPFISRCLIQPVIRTSPKLHMEHHGLCVFPPDSRDEILEGGILLRP